MLKRYLLTSAAAVACATALTSAQTPVTGAAPQVPPAAQSAPPSPQSTTTDRAERSPMTMTGCLMREQDIPGHAPSDADRAGRLEDFILTSASNPRADAAKPGAAASAAVGTSGTTAAATANNGAMYKIKGISDMQLKSLVGKRVEVVGLMNAADMKVSSSAAAPSAKTPAVGSGSQTQTGTDANAGRGEEKTQWSSFAASSIREVPGSCSASSNR
jgi:hypothetical protein